MNRFLKAPTLFLSIAVFFIYFHLADAQQNPYTFSADLRAGDNKPAVMELQKFLNSNPETVIAAWGPGSPGQETTYFGEKTKQAVIKFQEKYKQEVLTPVFLTSGTGFVGLKTRALINKLQSNKISDPSKVVTVTTPSPIAPQKPKITPPVPSASSIPTSREFLNEVKKSLDKDTLNNPVIENMFKNFEFQDSIKRPDILETKEGTDDFFAKVMAFATSSLSATTLNGSTTSSVNPAIIEALNQPGTEAALKEFSQAIIEKARSIKIPEPKTVSVGEWKGSFREFAKANGLKSESKNTLVQTGIDFLGGMFFPKKAYALGLSWGGILTYWYPCICATTVPAVASVVIGPNGGFFIYDATRGTVPFALYNFPYTTYVLGQYNPAIQLSCWMGVLPYCWPMVSMGHMTIIGSGTY